MSEGGDDGFAALRRLADEIGARGDLTVSESRLRLRREIASYRLEVRRTGGRIRIADALAKFGGGSLLTAMLLLIVNGQAAAAAIAVASLALLSFVVGTIWLVRHDERIARSEHAAELIEALLKEVE